MSGIDEQYETLITNNVFHQIFRSIRLDYAEGVEERIGWLLEVLPHTTIKDIEEMKEYLDRLLQVWEQNNPAAFSPSRWIRDGPYCYMTPEAWMTDWKYVDLLDTEDRDFGFPDYGKTKRIYDLWKSHCLTWREGE